MRSVVSAAVLSVLLVGCNQAGQSPAAPAEPAPAADNPAPAAAPGTLSALRNLALQDLRELEFPSANQASYFTACNRNKRSITVDMAHPEGQALLQRIK